MAQGDEPSAPPTKTGPRDTAPGGSRASRPSVGDGVAEDDPSHAPDRLRTLSRRLFSAQEVERQRISRELHDDIGQALSAVKMNLQAVRRAAGSSEMAAPIQDSIDIVDHAIRRVRDLSVALRPSLLDDLGLVPALRWFIDRQTERGGFRFTFEADELGPLSAEVETACFRIAQEAITNVVRHAGARHVALRLRRDGDFVELIIADDGRGFDVQIAVDRIGADASLGLLGMRERARLLGGRVTIQSALRKGTTVRARVHSNGREGA